MYVESNLGLAPSSWQPFLPPFDSPSLSALHIGQLMQGRHSARKLDYPSMDGTASTQSGMMRIHTEHESGQETAGLI